MDYVIKNHKNVYIRLNEHGKPVTCTDKDKGMFEHSKARNILDSLPKTLKKLRFKVEAVPDIIGKDIKQDEYISCKSGGKIVKNDNYIVPDNVLQWVEKFGICDDILKEAEKRKKELNHILSNFDRTISNWLHDVELEPKKNASAGYQKYSDIKDVVDKRREIKDELMIISNVLRMDFRQLDRERINKAVYGLAKRKFTYRVAEEVRTENVV